MYLESLEEQQRIFKCKEGVSEDGKIWPLVTAGCVDGAHAMLVYIRNGVTIYVELLMYILC